MLENVFLYRERMEGVTDVYRGQGQETQGCLCSLVNYYKKLFFR